MHEFELLPPPDEPDGGAAPADREPSMQEMLDMLESLSVNIKTFENDPSMNDEDGGADEILNSPASESGAAAAASSRRSVHRKERSRANVALQASFTRVPSMNRSGSFGRRGGEGGDGDDADKHKLVGTLFFEAKLVAQTFAEGFSKMIGRAREGAEDEEAKLRQIEDIIGERLRRGTLKPPAIGEGTLHEDVAVFFTDELPFRISRALFIKVLMILEYLRLKEAGDADPFWATARGRTMLMEHTLLRRLDPIPPNVTISEITEGGDRSDGASGSAGASGSGSGGGGGGGSGGLTSADVAAHLAAVRYHEALVAHLKQREGEPDLDMTAAGQDPLTQLGSQVSSYSAVFSI